MSGFQVIDGHCDTVLKLLQNNDCRLERLDSGHISIDSLRAGGVRLQFFAICCRCVNNFITRLNAGLRLADMYHLMLNCYPDDFMHIEKYEDIDKAEKAGKIGTLLTIEGGEALEGEISNLRIFYRLGVRSITLTWMYRNEIADGIRESSAGGGLSDFGREVVRDMNRLGMLIDVSHISVKGFWDVVELSTDPVIATHSNAIKLCSHPRNLNDEQILEIAKKGGVIGINFFEEFLRNEGRAGITDIIKHIEYIAALAGCDCLAIGTDFDGMDRAPEGADSPRCFPVIAERLLGLNYREEDVYKIFSGNYLRILKKVL